MTEFELINDLTLLKGGEIDLIDWKNIPCKELSYDQIFEKNPLVSIVVITYNHEAYIEKTIESILQQKTTFPFEIIISDDFSTDRTQEIIINYQSKYPDLIRLLCADINVGITKNAIRADLKTRGKYIAYCEGDDYWIDHNKLQKQAEIMESDPCIGLIFSRAKEFDYDKNHFIEINPLKSISIGLHNSNEFFMKRLCSSISLTTCTTMVRQHLIINAIKNHVVFKINSSMMDTPRWFAASYNMKTFYMNDITGVYVLHGDSVSSNWNLKETARQGCVVLYGFLKTMTDCTSKKIESKVLFRMISHAFYNHDLTLAAVCQEIASESKISLSFFSQIKLLAIKKTLAYKILNILMYLLRKIKSFL